MENIVLHLCDVLFNIVDTTNGKGNFDEQQNKTNIQ